MFLFRATDLTRHAARSTSITTTNSQVLKLHDITLVDELLTWEFRHNTRAKYEAVSELIEPGRVLR